jgi:hypothetical protein
VVNGLVLKDSNNHGVEEEHGATACIEDEIAPKRAARALLNFLVRYNRGKNVKRYRYCHVVTGSSSSAKLASHGRPVTVGYVRTNNILRAFIVAVCRNQIVFAAPLL